MNFSMFAKILKLSNMKKIIFVAVAALSFGFANAQSREKGTIELIPQIGYGASNFYGDSDISADPLSSISYGVGADYFFNDRWSLRSGILVQTMGAVDSADSELKLQYLSVPVNANWHFGSTRKWNLNFGPSIGFLTSAKVESVDVKDAFKSTQIAFNIGIGYKIEVSEKFSILIDYQSVTGLSKAFDEGSSAKNSYGSFNLGAVLKL